MHHQGLRSSRGISAIQRMEDYAEDFSKKTVILELAVMYKQAT